MRGDPNNATAIAKIPSRNCTVVGVALWRIKISPSSSYQRSDSVKSTGAQYDAILIPSFGNLSSTAPTIFLFRQILNFEY